MQDATPSYATKGSHIVQALAFVDQQLGAGTFLSLARQFGAGTSWDSILASEWYDALVLNEVLKFASNKLHRSVESITTDIARQNALQDLTTIYRLFLRVTEPVRMLDFTAQLWRNYVSFGDSRVLTNEPGHYIGETAGLPELLLDWACGEWLGFIPTAIELTGSEIQSAQITERHRDGQASRVTCEVHYELVG